MKSEKEIIGFLSTLLSNSISVEAKKNDLHKKYHFEMTEEIKEDAVNMCNIGTATLLKGEQKKAVEMAVKLLKRGKDSIEEIAELTELPLETVKQLAKENASAE